MKIAFHIACQRSTSEMDDDWVTLAATYSQGYSIFQKQHELAVSEFAVLLERFWIHNPADVTSQWFQNIGTKTI